MPFTCTICEEESTRICVACTKDTCGNHLCEKCRRCSDCCDCELRRDESEPVEHNGGVEKAVVEEEEDVVEEFEEEIIAVTGAEAWLTEEALAEEGPREPQPHPHPLPDPDPAPEPDPMPIPGMPGPEENN